ncbi:MAG: response regulator transcription factor [Gammaproteobacteria bacterium]
MLILACADKKILKRWQDAFEGDKNYLVVSNTSSLKNRLKNQPDVTVILHRLLPGISDSDDATVNQLHASYPDARLMVLADVPHEQQGIDFIRSGILGYANSLISPEILREAIKVIELGEIWVSKRLLEWMVNHCRDVEQHTKDLGSYLALDMLTPSEKHVIEHLVEGNNNKEIARKLNITERTVKAHLTSIYSKTGVKDRLHLALLVHNNGTL